MVWERVRAGDIVIGVIEIAALGKSTTAFCLPPESGDHSGTSREMRAEEGAAH